MATKKTTPTRSKSNTTRRTAGGAQQYDRELDTYGSSRTTSMRVSEAMRRDLSNLSRSEFQDKYGMNFREASAMLDAADAARSSENIRRVTNGESSTSKMYDRWERDAQSRGRGYAKGGVVKANCGASTKPNRKARK